MSKKNRAAPPGKPGLSSNRPTITAAAGAALPIIYSAQIAHTQTLTGPIPPPEMLRQYEAISAGMVERLLKLAESEAEHRRQVELQVITSKGRISGASEFPRFWGKCSGS